MSYQVLARKWRPQTFSELVGQQHVVDAITNALQNDKLHHAYLFTGTRGVGKTTIARIFSKSLNCEQGQSANPCGKCSTCQDISDGRYVDLLEIDAASRTKVEDTRELLDNVQYRPTRGKYKVYLIDEVHMLSKHSFNALLKTLEEPPEHVKFLLATTDPQKLPVTILSRCLQFSLRALTKEQIQSHLSYILNEEKVTFEDAALAQIAKAAQGSIRDSLSLTDQAIAQGNNQVSLQIVANMLGLLNKNQVLKLVKLIGERDNVGALTQLDDICMQSPDYAQVIAQILALLHQIALTQVVPEVCKLEGDSAKGIYILAKSLSKEHIQILYQIGVNGKRDLPHAPDPRSGLQMTVLRMLAFSPKQKIELDVDALISEDTNLPAFETIQAPVQTLSTNAASAAKPNESNQALTEEASNKQAHNATTEQSSLTSDNKALDTAEREAVASLEEIARNQAAQSEKQQVDTALATADASRRTDENKSLSSSEQGPVQSEPEQSEPVQSEPEQSEPEQSEPVQSEPEQQYTEQQPPFNDQEPPMFDDMFADDPIPMPAANMNEQAYDRDNDASGYTPSNSQAETPENSKSHKSETLRLLKLSKQLDALSEDKPGDPNGKKSDAEPVATQQQVAEPSYAIGHEFRPFSGNLSAFINNNEKLLNSAQVDEWSKFVDASGLQALSRQLLIHANCSELANPIKLKLKPNDAHLCEDAIIEKVQSTLSKMLAQEITLEIEYGETENTPFQLQLSIDTMRLNYAHELINNEGAIQELIKAFDAKVVEGSVEAR